MTQVDTEPKTAPEKDNTIEKGPPVIPTYILVEGDSQVDEEVWMTYAFGWVVYTTSTLQTHPGKTILHIDRIHGTKGKR